MSRQIITRNSARCNKCNDEIVSTHVHDFKWCSCKAIAVDGGKEYLKRLGNREDWTETSITVEQAKVVPIRKKARLDADKSAKPLTTLKKQIVSSPHVICQATETPVSMTLEDNETGEKIPVAGTRNAVLNIHVATKNVLGKQMYECYFADGSKTLLSPTNLKALINWAKENNIMNARG